VSYSIYNLFTKAKSIYFVQFLLVTYIRKVTTSVFIGFEVLTAVVMKSSIFWVITPCSKLLATCFHSGLLLGLFFGPEDRGDIFLRNVG
jgi:hypothetical protein